MLKYRIKYIATSTLSSGNMMMSSTARLNSASGLKLDSLKPISYKTASQTSILKELGE